MLAEAISLQLLVVVVVVVVVLSTPNSSPHFAYRCLKLPNVLIIPLLNSLSFDSWLEMAIQNIKHASSCLTTVRL